jgi:hypothetical protein
MVFIMGLLGVKGKKIKKIGNNKGKKGCNRSKKNDMSERGENIIFGSGEYSSQTEI